MGLFSRIFSVFNPPPHIEQKHHEAIERGYKKHRRMVFSGIFFGYIASYLIRNNFSLAIPHLTHLGYTKSKLGIAFSAGAIAYGFSKFLMGNLSDRSNPKFFLAAGLIGSVTINFLFGFSPWSYSGIITMFILLFINGWVQGMTFGPCVRVLAHWYSIKERGVVMSFWSSTQNMGAAASALLAMFGIWMFGQWQSIFYLPALIALAIAIYVLFTVEDTPQSVGFPSVESYHSKNYLKKHAIEVAAKEIEAELTAKEIFFKHVFNNKAVWLLSIANIFIYFVRYGILTWAPAYLHEVKGFDYKGQSLAYFLFEAAGVVSLLLCGHISNKYLRNKRVPVIVVSMILVVFAVLLYWLNPPGRDWVDYLALILVGFLIYGPVVFIGMQTIDVVYKKAVGTASGLTGFFGYMFGTVGSSAVLGFAVQHLGWGAGFVMIIIAAILAALILLPIWHAGGEDYKTYHHRESTYTEMPVQSQ